MNRRERHLFPIRRIERDGLALQRVVRHLVPQGQPDLEQHPLLAHREVRELVAEDRVRLVVIGRTDVSPLHRHDLRHPGFGDLIFGGSCDWVVPTPANGPAMSKATPTSEYRTCRLIHDLLRMPSFVGCRNTIPRR